LDSAWNIRDAYINNGNGERVVDLRGSNLHVVTYSRPVRQRMRLSELGRLEAVG
jgi:aminopeptidase-like protein